MSGTTPFSISVIIPVAPGGPVDRALAALVEVDYPQEKLEVIVVEGRQPSVQRNEATKHASGEIFFFLDSDSEADIDLFRFVMRSFQDPQVAVVGGPSEILSSDPFLQKCFGFVLSSYFGTTSVRCRYKSIGRGERAANENHLILANMGVRGEVFLRAGGFDERLYPNEENEFLNRLSADGCKLIYNPKAIVRRPHRTSFFRFARQMFTYGRGRMDQLLLHPSVLSPLRSVPLLFTLYFLSLAIFHPIWYLVPLMLYLLAGAVATMRIVVDEEDVRTAFVVPPLFPTVHFCYAAGMLWGLLKRGGARVRHPRLAPAVEVKVNFVKPFGTQEYGAAPWQEQGAGTVARA